MEIFNFIKQLHDESLQLSKKIIFNHKHPRQLHLIGLYGSLIELSGSLVILIDQKVRAGVSSIFRTILETYVEFHNLYEKAEYGYHMNASHHKEWIKVLEEAKDKSNPYLKGISGLENLNLQIKEHNDELSKLKEKGFTPLRISERFERAGMESEYRSLYNFLSCDAHSNIRALFNRHANIHADCKYFNVVYYTDEPLESFLTYIDSTSGLLVNASNNIHKYFETGLLKEVEKIENELKAIRSK